MSEHARAHLAARAGERRRVVAVLALTSAILVAEVVGGLLSHSLALLSDAGHMLSDVAAQVLSLAALAIAVTGALLPAAWAARARPATALRAE